MIYIILLMSLLFAGIGYLLKEDKVKSLMSDPNELDKPGIAEFDFKSFFSFFKKFHIFLGFSLTLIGLSLTLFNKNAGGIFLVVYPLLAYIYFLWKSVSFSTGVNSTRNKVTIGFLGIVVLGVSVLILSGLKEDSLILYPHELEITGSYGEVLQHSEIRSIELINELPQIISKKNGFSLGTIDKGFFKTKNEEVVKLIINSDHLPVILFTMNNGNRIYYSARSKSNEEIINDLREMLPSVVKVSNSKL